MNIFQLNKILLEYNKSGKLTTLSEPGGDKASGKSFDRIAAGLTTPKQQSTREPSKTEKQFPNLAKTIEQMKNNSVKGNKVVIGVALNELKNLIQTRNLQQDENGEIILPFGDDVRLIQKGNNFFIRLKSVADQEKQQQNIDLTENPLPNL